MPGKRAYIHGRILHKITNNLVEYITDITITVTKGQEKIIKIIIIMSKCQIDKYR